MFFRFLLFFSLGLILQVQGLDLRHPGFSFGPSGPRVLSKDDPYQLIPNPGLDAVQLRLFTETQTLEYEILDLSGRRLKKGLCQNEEGQFFLSVKGLKEGAYFIRWSTGSESRTAFFQKYW